jgi:hypothetical protein
MEQTSDIFLAFADSNKTIISNYIQNILNVPKANYEPFLEYVSEKHDLCLNNVHERSIATIILIKSVLYN